MSTPARPIPRKFYRVAYQRLEEAEVLFEAGYYITQSSAMLPPSPRGYAWAPASWSCPITIPCGSPKPRPCLDVLSGGRLILGVGVGVIEQEFNALGSAYAERGAITDEAIAIMQALWTQAVPSHQGLLYRFSGLRVMPRR